ncbi:hypothetical protein ISN45_At01g033710 [Arabidopsis thaliana x Arabidopsis arenosa]|nr:hypothetical protein ISN45_At01g033710 [Arabidopsis thaliana x Arabidopsis arenosa]
MHIRITEEAERLREQQREVEARNLGEAELAKMKKKLQDSYEDRMSQMQKMVNIRNIFIIKMIMIPVPAAFNEILLSFQMENTLKETSAAQESMMRMLRENLQKAQSDNESMRYEHDQLEQRRMMIQLGLSVPAVIGTGLGLGLPCSIL